MKTLEDYKENFNDLLERNELKKFVKQKVHKYSDSEEKIITDFKFYERYNFIVTDLIERKLIIEKRKKENDIQNKVSSYNKQTKIAPTNKNININNLDSLVPSFNHKTHSSTRSQQTKS